jgi:hypothetical protein
MLLFKDILPILAIDHKDGQPRVWCEYCVRATDDPVFNQAFILNAFHLLLNKLLPLTSTDLESLEDEPEEWVIAEKDDEEAWAFEFRVSCTPESCVSVVICVADCISHVPSES